ncbi:methyltransferase domain-containing protein [Rubritalea spongiae]|uniref:Methyltransferase domain-containing protein n=1 Tax=Rubritalea spongiae TaxID=430797 RepID=A0ABW5E3A0_9BACT
MDWQARYQVGDTPWDKGCVTPVLTELIGKNPFFFGESKRFFVPGCGFGYDALAIAETGSSVIGMDIAESAVKQAQRLESAERELSFVSGDIFELAENLYGRFDFVWEHTCFCALDPSLRSRYVEQMWKVLKQGGAVVGVFFINPDVAAGEGPPYGASREEIRALFASHFVLEWESEPKCCYEGREGREHVMLFRRLTDCREIDC